MDKNNLEDLWKDLDEAETGILRPNSWLMMMINNL